MVRIEGLEDYEWQPWFGMFEELNDDLIRIFRMELLSREPKHVELKRVVAIIKWEGKILAHPILSWNPLQNRSKWQLPDADAWKSVQLSPEPTMPDKDVPLYYFVSTEEKDGVVLPSHLYESDKVRWSEDREVMVQWSEDREVIEMVRKALIDANLIDESSR
jgi:hypothetical protein